MERVGKVSQLTIYPIKSAAGVSVKSALCTSQGLQDVHEPYLRDRRWAVILITEKTGKTLVLGGRQQPRLTLVQPAVKGKTLILNAPNMPQLEVAIEDTPSDPSQVHKFRMAEFNETGEGIDCGQDAAEWFSKFLDKPRVRLIYSAPDMRRRKAKDQVLLGMTHPVAKLDNEVAFADCVPYLMVGQTSLDDLNSRLENVISARQFRPNIVVAGAVAYAEDKWDEVHLGDARLRGTWNAGRCVFATVDPTTGIKDPQKEPLTTLLKYREGDGKKLDFPGFPVFGKLMLGDQEGIVSVGDDVKASLPSPL